MQENLIAKAQADKAVAQGKPQKSVRELIKSMEGEIAKALPSVITPERFTRITLSALSTTPKLAECSPRSFLAAMMTAAQLGRRAQYPARAGVFDPLSESRRSGVPIPVGLQGPH